jgi:hypothetical protein
VARLLETLAWWPPLCGLWLLTLSAFSVAELLAAVALALPCAAAATVARRAAGASWRVRTSWARWLIPLPAAVLADTVRVLLAVLHRPVVAGARGQLRRVTLHPESDPARAAGQRALAVVALSLPPGSVVVGSAGGQSENRGTADGNSSGDRGGEELALHVLVDGAPRMSEVVGR